MEERSQVSFLAAMEGRDVSYMNRLGEKEKGGKNLTVSSLRGGIERW